MAHVIIKCRVTFGKKMFNDCIKPHSICMRLVLSTQEEFSLKRAHYGHCPLHLQATVKDDTRSFDRGNGFIGTQTDIPSKFSFTSDCGHFKFIRFKKKDTEIPKFMGVVPRGFKKCGDLTPSTPPPPPSATTLPTVAGGRTHIVKLCLLLVVVYRRYITQCRPKSVGFTTSSKI